jgi:hypothetical protein
MLTYRDGSDAMRGGADVVISLTPSQAAAIGGEDLGELAEAFDTVLAAVASARGDRKQFRPRPSFKDGRDDADWHSWVVRDVTSLRSRLDGLLRVAIRGHAAGGGSYGGLAEAMGVSRATAQSRRDAVTGGNALTPAEVWVTARAAGVLASEAQS